MNIRSGLGRIPGDGIRATGYGRRVTGNNNITPTDTIWEGTKRKPHQTVFGWGGWERYGLGLSLPCPLLPWVAQGIPLFWGCPDRWCFTDACHEPGPGHGVAQ